MAIERDVDIKKKEYIQHDFHNIVRKTPRAWNRPWILEKHEIQVNDSKDISLKMRVKNHHSNKEDESTCDDDDLIKNFENLLRK